MTDTTGSETFAVACENEACEAHGVTVDVPSATWAIMPPGQPIICGACGTAIVTKPEE